MKALLLNSGLGRRMKDLTTCKCLVELDNDGTTILDAQIKSLMCCGITDIYITTGPYADKLEYYVQKQYPQGQFTFINNPIYDQTNYIYSMQLASDFLRGEDIVLMHGDLVFEQNVLQDLIASHTSCMIVDTTQPLPEKDFKAVIKENRVIGVGVEFFANSVYAQPLYKLNKKDWDIWLDAICNFCLQGKTNVYAEDALNTISHLMEIRPLDINGRICFEVDNREDVDNAQKAYAKMPDRLQEVYAGHGSFCKAKEVVAFAKKPFVVCKPRVKDVISSWGLDLVFFDEFTPNPDFDQVLKGIQLFKKEDCDLIVSIGGGSAIDVAKGISILRGKDMELLNKPRAKHLSIPTTAGTGSESTRFAVLYTNGEKFSVEHESILPEYVILDPEFLDTLPIYHKKSALLDALCQAVESIWAKGQTFESKAYALSALNIILNNIDAYLDGDKESALRILQASNLAGRAINISKTTAAHAMSYKLSSLFGIAHGHAVALCMLHVWAHLIKGNNTPSELHAEMYTTFRDIVVKLDMDYDFGYVPESLLSELVSSVNIHRLSNHPIRLSDHELAYIYQMVLDMDSKEPIYLLK